MSTPTPPEGPNRYDDLPPSEAVVLAWTEYPAVARDAIARDMPLLDRRRPQRRARPPLWRSGEEWGGR